MAINGELFLAEDDDTLEANGILGQSGEIDESDISIGSNDFQSMVVAPTDWTISVFADLLRRKKIDLSPNYQRRIAWTERKMSKFIESLFLRLPVPQVVLAETSPGKFAIIDGKQRVNSLARFCNDEESPLVLQDCEYLSQINKHTFSEMKDSEKCEGMVDAFESHTIRTIVVKSIPSDDVLYLLFLRLNQNSVPLSPQELRRALRPGPFLDWLDEKTANSEGMSFIFGKTPDFRMRDMEVATRFLAFYYLSNEYRGNLKIFLDDATKYMSQRWGAIEIDLERVWLEYEWSIKMTRKIFEGDAFKVFVDGRYQSSKNRAVMDIMTYYFSRLNYQLSDDQCRGIKARFERLCTNDREFLSFLQTSTKTVGATTGRFRRWRDALVEILGDDVPACPF